MLMAFQCRKCGNCCRVPGYVRLRSGEPERMAAFLGLDLQTFLNRYTRLTADRRGLSLNETPAHRCVFLDAAGKCVVNEVKPRQCRDFPVGWSFQGYEEICAGFRA